jgi:DNA helicase-2/ATP-dependent DNA helicase PcrA
LGIDARDIAAVGNYAKRYNLSLFESVEKIDDINVSDVTRGKVKKIIGIIKKHLKLMRRESAGQLLYYFLEETGLLTQLLAPTTADAEKKAANISKFFDKLKTYEVDHEDATVLNVVDWIDLSVEMGESPAANDTDWVNVNAVNILTVHSSKGLEFPVVFLVNLTSGRFPTIERREQIPIPDDLIREILPKGDYHMQEERRLFYVGMTRAEDRLFFSTADYYGEGKREKKASPFIFEALGDGVLASEEKQNKEQLSFLDYSSNGEKKESKKSLIHVDYLSYSQIETFKVCPLHYKLKYIYKVPTPPSSAQSFGISIHSALKDFYISIKQGKKANEKLLINLLEDNWVREGFSSKSHEGRSFGKAKEFLCEYFEKEYDKKRIPLLLEQPFTIPLGVELKIGGKIDRVDELAGGGIEIIDYKTGANVPTQREVDHDMQLTFYALAATTMKEKPFGRMPKEVKLTLYYFDGHKKISTTRTKSDLEKAKEEIFKIRDEIEKSDFTCSGGMLCRNCEYRLLCKTEY